MYLVESSFTIANLLTVSSAIFHESWHDGFRHLLMWMVLAHNIPENVAVMGPSQKTQLPVPEALKDRMH